MEIIVSLEEWIANGGAALQILNRCVQCAVHQARQCSIPPKTLGRLDSLRLSFDCKANEHMHVLLWREAIELGECSKCRAEKVLRQARGQ